MGYGKSKPTMFKMKHSGVPALMKTLTGGQKEMVSKMRADGKTSAADKIEKGILAQPENAAAKSYGSKSKAALMKNEDPTEKEKKEKAAKRKKAMEAAKKAREEFQAKNPDAQFNTPTKQPKKKPSTIATGIKGDLPTGGYSKKQKDFVVAEELRIKAEKKRKKAKASGVDVEAPNRRFRKNTSMGRKLTEQGL